MAFQFLSADEPWMIQAAELLCRPSVLSDLRKSDARCIVSYMRPCRFEDGDVLLQEGEQGENAHMLLVLHGDVSVETSMMSREQPVVVTVLGEGGLIGEMALLDGAPRVATCVAQSTVICASLTRRDLRRMMDDEPVVAARLLASIGERLAERLREANRQQRLYQQLMRAMQDEIDELGRQLQCVIGGSVQRGQAEAAAERGTQPASSWPNSGS
ncbi:cyclic nucleotide-binding domain-containing protein [Ideonella sp. B508-1]|uniref:cyclic nucleotide-binding domain-containing protein n=1 Tax=Ideonella sp. B508-1 TaxID=137716 RepID=UPI00034DD89F|nr:cyclic nucleotide-binding domain-containing protein [Ideonella sp. B508-1]